MSTTSIKTALLSVHDKTGIVDFALGLQNLSINLMSTSGTARLLSSNGITVREISDYTGFPEILDGRVKTLHPKIHAGLLFRRDHGDDQMALQKLGIQAIDMAVVNLYPFEKTVSYTSDLNDAIENIDIGGPTMIRAAAKNYRDVAVVTDPADYSRILSELKNNSCKVSHSTRLELMLKAFERTAAYDAAISSYFTQVAFKQGVRSEWPGPERLVLSFEKVRDLRYGENPHQKAAVYKDLGADNCIASARLAAGQKELSYTNILDADAAYRFIREFKSECVTAIIKHTNPCGVGKGKTLLESCQKALQTDPASAFGGIYVFSKKVDSETADFLGDKFVELVLAPGYEPDALNTLSAKKNRRILDLTDLLTAPVDRRNYRRIYGGILYQDRDQLLMDEGKLKVATKRQPTPDENSALMFGWTIVKHVKSNAIVLCSKDQLIGVGAGQMSRVDSCKIALMKAKEAGLETKGAVMASDAYLPFRDSVDLMEKAGVTAIIQPGGSIRDREVVQAADKFEMAMVFTGVRHFAH
jgi:phosphoribosylaminoimidazolecarboxamide formyltransferase/IMP cyclohydrolase